MDYEVTVARALRVLVRLLHRPLVPGLTRVGKGWHGAHESTRLGMMKVKANKGEGGRVREGESKSEVKSQAWIEAGCDQEGWKEGDETGREARVCIKAASPRTSICAGCCGC